MSRYFWLKLRRDFFKRHDVKIIKAMPDGEKILLFYLELLAESVDHEGRLRFSPEVAYDNEMLAIITDTDKTTVDTATEILERLGMIKTEEDGTIIMPYAVKLIDSAEGNDNAVRQARYREKKRKENDVTTKSNTMPLRKVTECVTKSNTNALRKVTDTVTKNNESIELDTDIELDIERENIERETADKSARTPRSRFTPPDPDEILAYMTDYAHKKGLTLDVVLESEKFFNYYTANNWRVGRNPMRDFKATARNWLLNAKEYTHGSSVPDSNPFIDLIDEGGTV